MPLVMEVLPVSLLFRIFQLGDFPNISMIIVCPWIIDYVLYTSPKASMSPGEIYIHAKYSGTDVVYDILEDLPPRNVLRGLLYNEIENMSLLSPRIKPSRNTLLLLAELYGVEDWESIIKMYTAYYSSMAHTLGSTNYTRTLHEYKSLSIPQQLGIFSGMHGTPKSNMLMGIIMCDTQYYHHIDSMSDRELHQAWVLMNECTVYQSKNKLCMLFTERVLYKKHYIRYDGEYSIPLLTYLPANLPSGDLDNDVLMTSPSAVTYIWNHIQTVLIKTISIMDTPGTVEDIIYTVNVYEEMSDIHGLVSTTAEVSKYITREYLRYRPEVYVSCIHVLSCLGLYDDALRIMKYMHEEYEEATLSAISEPTGRYLVGIRNLDIEGMLGEYPVLSAAASLVYDSETKLDKLTPHELFLLSISVNSMARVHTHRKLKLVEVLRDKLGDVAFI